MKNLSTFSENHVALTRESLSKLCSFVVNGHIPIFTYGVIKNTIFSIVCTDANVDSYSGISLRLSAVDYDVNTHFHASRVGNNSPNQENINRCSKKLNEAAPALARPDDNRLAGETW